MSEPPPSQHPSQHPPTDPLKKIFGDPGGAGGVGSLDDFVRGLEQLGSLKKLNNALPARVNADPHNVERGLAQLVLTLVELLRQLMERQAVRRMEGGSLTDDEVERLGQTFIKLEQRMRELKEAFGLKDADLNIDLGPLGKLL